MRSYPGGGVERRLHRLAEQPRVVLTLLIARTDDVHHQSSRKIPATGHGRASRAHWTVLSDPPVGVLLESGAGGA